MVTSTGKLDRIAFIIVSIVVFLAPIFFVPSLSVPFQTGKAAFILYGIALAFALWCIARLKDGVYSFPKSLLFVSAGVLALVYSLAALFSANQGASLSGQGFELGTLSFFLPSILLFLMVPLTARSQKDLFFLVKALIMSVVVVGLFHLIRFIFGPEVLSFDIFTSLASNIFGKWNDLAVFFGLGIIMSLITLERAELSKTMKFIVYVALILSLITIVVVNYSLVWIVLAILSLIYLIYELSFGKKSIYLGARMPYHTLAILVISVIFIFAGNKIGGVISSSMDISQLEVRPSWSATYEVSKETLKENPLFGAGPNRFSSEWLLNKPTGINTTLFWNVDFNYGIGFIPSFIVTTGILGFLAILFFAGLLFYRSVKALFHEGSSPTSRNLVLTSLFGTIYLIIFSVLYVPSASLWIITMAVAGLFVASLRENGSLNMVSITVVDKPAASFISVLITILLLIASLSFGYFVTIKLISNIYFQKAITGINKTGDLDVGAMAIGSAAALSPSDVHFQSLSELYLAKINVLLNDKEISQAEAQKQFQDYLSASIQAAQEAVRLDPTNYRNHLAAGRIFEAVVPLKIEGAYDNAKKSYEAALALNPESPEIYLILARLEVTNKNNTAAKDLITKALEKKGDYADAIFLLSQIQISENDLTNAIKSVEAVATLSPSDSGVFFQLGLLYYSEKNYANAVLALERATDLNPQYANAKYFLGLAYYQVGEKEKALTEFTELETTNPDNEEIKTIVANLKAGKAPVSSQVSPEKRSTVPVKETSTKEEI